MSDDENKWDSLSPPLIVEYEGHRKSLPYIIGYLESSLLTIKELVSTDQNVNTKVYQKVDEAIKFLQENFPKIEKEVMTENERN